MQEDTKNRAPRTRRNTRKYQRRLERVKSELVVRGPRRTSYTLLEEVSFGETRPFFVYQ